jgi:hypothetical protein
MEVQVLFSALSKCFALVAKYLINNMKRILETGSATALRPALRKIQQDFTERQVLFLEN